MPTNNDVNSIPLKQRLHYSQRSDVVVINAVIPVDTTIPQITEGNQVLSITFTPTSATNIVHIKFSCFCLGGGVIKCAAIFQDATTDCLASNMIDTAGFQSILSVDYVGVVGTNAATTFQVRVGIDSLVGAINSDIAGNPLFDGTASCCMTITETEV